MFILYATLLVTSFAVINAAPATTTGRALSKCQIKYPPVAGYPADGTTSTICYDTSYYSTSNQGNLQGSGDKSLILQSQCEALCSKDGRCQGIVGATQFASDSDAATGVCFFYDHTPSPRQCSDGSKRAIRAEEKKVVCGSTTTSTTTTSTTRSTTTTSSSSTTSSTTKSTTTSSSSTTSSSTTKSTTTSSSTTKSTTTSSSTTSSSTTTSSTTTSAAPTCTNKTVSADDTSPYQVTCGSSYLRSSSNLITSVPSIASIEDCINQCEDYYASNAVPCYAVDFYPASGTCYLLSDNRGGLTIDSTAIRATKGPTSTCTGGIFTGTSGKQYDQQCNVYFNPGTDFLTYSSSKTSFQQCIQYCDSYSGCKVITFNEYANPHQCSLFSGTSGGGNSNIYYDTAFLVQ